MTPAIKPAKVQITKTLDGRLHVAMGLGPKVPVPMPQALVSAKQFHRALQLSRSIASFELWQANMFAVEPSPATGESWEQFLNRLYSE